MRIAILLAVGLLLVGCGGNGNGNDGSGGGSTSMDCEIGGDESKAELADLEDGKTHSVAVDTSKGSFTFELATDTSPCTTASFAGLVKKGFFDGLTFHRIVPGFVIQSRWPSGVSMKWTNRSATCSRGPFTPCRTATGSGVMAVAAGGAMNWQRFGPTASWYTRP